MKQPSIILKASVLAIFLCLVAALVAYRSGAFDGLLNGNWPMENENIHARNSIDSPPPEKPIMRGSKSAPVVLPTNKTRADSFPIIDTPRVILPGSKSFMVVPPTHPSTRKDSAQKQQQQKVDSVKPKKIMPSTKSMGLFRTDDIKSTSGGSSPVLNQ